LGLPAFHFGFIIYFEARYSAAQQNHRSASYAVPSPPQGCNETLRTSSRCRGEQ